MLRPAIVSQAIIVRPDSPITHVQALRHKPIAVNFHAGSHYLTLQLLEGFMEREAITVVHVGQAPGRYRALWEGRVDAVTVMEPYRYTTPRPYPEEEFARTYDWMVSWNLIPAGATYDRLVDNRIGVVSDPGR